MAKPFSAVFAGLAFAFVVPSVHAAPAGPVPMSAFELRTAQDLLNLCTAAPTDPDHVAAHAFCYGFVSGGQHYHDEISVVDGIQPIVCPDGKKTRDEVVAVFVTYMGSHPDAAGRRPMDALVEAAATRWPCPETAAGTK